MKGLIFVVGLSVTVNTFSLPICVDVCTSKQYCEQKPLPMACKLDKKNKCKKSESSRHAITCGFWRLTGTP